MLRLTSTIINILQRVGVSAALHKAKANLSEQIHAEVSKWWSSNQNVDVVKMKEIHKKSLITKNEMNLTIHLRVHIIKASGFRQTRLIALCHT